MKIFIGFFVFAQTFSAQIKHLPYWGEKVYTPLISLLFIGVLTTFVTIYFTLKDSKEESFFLASIVVNKNDRTIEPFTQEVKVSKVALRQFLYYEMSAENSNNKTDSVKPQNEKETIKYLQKLIQYRIIITLLRNQKINQRYVSDNSI